MIGVIFNEYKGYCIPKNGYYEDYEDCGEVITDGFDHFNWEHEQTKPNNFYELFRDADNEPMKSEELYDNESKVALNHKRSGELKTNAETDEESSPKAKKKRIPKNQRKQERKREKKVKGCKKDKNLQHNFEHVASDAQKVRILNQLYKAIVSLSKKKKMDDKIFQFFDVSIYGEDLLNLKDDEWLSDNNISFIYEYLERYQLSKFDSLVSNAIQLVRPSMVYLLAQTPEPQQLIGVIPAIENGKFLFLPVNDNDDVEAVGAGSHWSLVVISMLEKIAFVYDSMERANEQEAKDVITKVEKYLSDGTKFQIRIMKTPQQLNGSDCGVIVSQITAFLTSRLLGFKYLKDHYVNLDLQQVKISAIDGRIFMMGTLLNVLRYKMEKA
jgi:sentrin-specific protease 8